MQCQYQHQLQAVISTGCNTLHQKFKELNLYVCGRDCSALALTHCCHCRCHAQTAPLFECMAKHRYYYGSQLDGMASSSKEREQAAAAAQAEVQQQGSSQPSNSSSSQPAADGSRGMDDSSSRAGGSQAAAAAAAAAKQTAETQQAGSSRLATM